MQAKKRSWTDVQLIISSISVALTLGFWSLMASREKGVASVIGEASLPETTIDLLEEQQQILLPGQVLYLNSVAPPTSAPVLTRTRERRGMRVV
jgi:hypothetical protein